MEHERPNDTRSAPMSGQTIEITTEAPACACRSKTGWEARQAPLANTRNGTGVSPRASQPGSSATCRKPASLSAAAR